MQTISRSKTIFVSINKVGRNYLPFVKELQMYPVKYIDIKSSFVRLANGSIIKTIDNNVYLTLADVNGNLFYDNVDIYNFTPNEFLGQRKLIDTKLILQNCFIANSDVANIGSIVAMTFYWDEPRFAYSGVEKKYFKETIELLVNITAAPIAIQRINFPDIRTLAKKRIKSIRPAYLFNSTVSPLGYKIFDRVNEFSVYLTLANGNNILIDQLNMDLMADINLLDYITFENILVNFPNSYIDVVMKFDEPLPTAETVSIPLIIEYMED